MRTNPWIIANFVATAALPACGGSTDTSTDPNSAVSTTSSSAGTGSFTVMNDPAATGEAPSYSVKVSFLPSAASCAKTNVGACQVNPCNGAAASTSSVPDVGEVTLSGAQLTAAPLAPAGGGTYAPEENDGVSAWTAAGEALTWTWAHAPGESTVAGGKVTLSTPPLITLDPSSAFAAPPSTLSRSHALTVAWTPASVPTANDTVLVDVVGPASNGVSTVVSCTSKASAGEGTIPVAALQRLPAGVGSYDVHSMEYLTQPVAISDGAPWTFEFNVDAHAITSQGVATGPVTFE